MAQAWLKLTDEKVREIRNRRGEKQAALAAELVQEHERRQGARAILVVGSADQAERVLADLGRR